MKTAIIRVPTRVHTRKLDRNVARERMKKNGIKHMNKTYPQSYTDAFGCQYIVRDRSYFAENWRTTTANRVLER